MISFPSEQREIETFFATKMQKTTFKITPIENQNDLCVICLGNDNDPEIKEKKGLIYNLCKNSHTSGVHLSCFHEFC